MYPSHKDPIFGVFVKNFKEGLENMGAIFTQKALIKGKGSSPVKKILKYSQHYFNILLGILKSNYDLMYIHYLTHHLPLLYVLIPLKKKKWIINVHGSDVLDIKPSGLVDKLAIKVLKNIDLIVVPTTYFKELVLKKYPFLAESNFYVSPSGGIDPNKFYVKNDKQPNEVLTLGFISRFIEEKGWKTFLESLIILKKYNVSFKAIMAGKGPDADKIIEYIKTNELGDQVNFLGLVKQDKLIDIYNSLDLYIFPSYRESESLGLTGLEAMSCGTPTVACNMAGPSTYIKNGVNGYLFTPMSTKELTEIIMKYDQLDPKEKQKIKANSITSSASFSTTNVNKKIYKKLEQLV